MQLISSDVATICTGLAASMGAVLLNSRNGGQALGPAPLARDDPSAAGRRRGTGVGHRNHGAADPAHQEGIVRNLSAHSGVKLSKIEKDADRDYWMTAPEAKEYGLIDEVLAGRKKK